MADFAVRKLHVRLPPVPGPPGSVRGGGGGARRVSRRAVVRLGRGQRRRHHRFGACGARPGEPGGARPGEPGPGPAAEDDRPPPSPARSSTSGKRPLRPPSSLARLPTCRPAWSGPSPLTKASPAARSPPSFRSPPAASHKSPGRPPLHRSPAAQTVQPPRPPDRHLGWSRCCRSARAAADHIGQLGSEGTIELTEVRIDLHPPTG